jgi:hypothetical protein
MSNWLSSWSAQVPAPNGSTSTSPALAALNGRLYACWKGSNNDQALWLSSSTDPVPVPPLLIRIVDSTNNSTTFAWDAFTHSTLQSLTMYMGEHSGILNWATQLAVTATSATEPLIPDYYNVWYTLQAVTIYGEKWLSNSVNVQYAVPPPPQVTVPNVVGMVYADAVTKLQGDGLQVEETSISGIFNTEDYDVTGQDTAPGTKVNNGALVKLTIKPIPQIPTTGDWHPSFSPEQGSPGLFSALAAVTPEVPADAVITSVQNMVGAAIKYAHAGYNNNKYTELDSEGTTNAFNNQPLTQGGWSADTGSDDSTAGPALSIKWKAT